MSDDYVIYPKDIERIHGVSNRTARRMLHKARKALGRPTGEQHHKEVAGFVTYREFKSVIFPDKV